MRTYTTRAQYVDGQWLLKVPELPGLSCHVEWIAEAEAEIRGVIASELNVKPESVGVEVVPLIRPEVAALVDEAAAATDELAKIQRKVSAIREQALDALTSEGLRAQDAAKILGIKSAQGLGDDDQRLGAA